MAIEMWVEKYRPKTFDEYVWKDATHRRRMEEYLADGALPHLLFSGSPGTGKTSLAMLLLKRLDIPDADILKINAAKERRIEDVQDRIVGFVSTWSMGPTGIKYVILDECEIMSPRAQRLLLTEMETYSDTTRFILTCNNPARIIDPIHSRCQTFTFAALDREDFICRIGEILTRENVEFDIDDVIALTDLTYPDLRKSINLAQKNTVGGKFHRPKTEDVEETKDYILEMVSLFQQGRIREARKLIAAQALVEDYPDIYRSLYRNLELWGDTERQQDQALIIIRNGLVNHSIAADPEINLSATLVELKLLKDGII